MKKLFTLLFVFAAVAVSAQSFSVTYSGQNVGNNDTIDVATITSQSMNTYIEYANVTSEGVFFKVRKEEIQVSDDAQATFCVGGACYTGNMSQEMYFDVRSFNGYGILSGRDVNDAQAGHRVLEAAGQGLEERKHDEADFAL